MENNSGKAGWGILIVIAVIVVGFLSNIGRISDPTSAFPTPAPTFNQPALPFPVTTSTPESLIPAWSVPLKIITSSGHYVIKMKNPVDGKLVSKWYLNPNSTTCVKVPPGTYVLQYACGDTWYGDKYYYGPNTAYSKADDTRTLERQPFLLLDTLHLGRMATCRFIDHRPGFRLTAQPKSRGSSGWSRAGLPARRSRRGLHHGFRNLAARQCPPGTETAPRPEPSPVLRRGQPHARQRRKRRQGWRPSGWAGSSPRPTRTAKWASARSRRETISIRISLQRNSGPPFWPSRPFPAPAVRRVSPWAPEAGRDHRGAVEGLLLRFQEAGVVGERGGGTP